MRAGEVFVAGGQPVVTYTSREVDAQALEVRLREYLEDERSILVVTGPSKAGKTVLLQHSLPPRSAAVYVPGGRIKTVADLWGRVVSGLDAWTDERKSVSRADAEGEGGGWRGSIAPFNVGAITEWSDTTVTTDTHSHERSRSGTLAETAANVLLKHRLPLVIDDFHHLARPLQAEVIAALKDLVFDGLPAIFAAVPHRVADAVQSQPEMNGRVEHLPLGLWTVDELVNIAVAGFGPDGLNARCDLGLAEAAAQYAQRSPHLMQRLCRELARVNGIAETLEQPRPVRGPVDWEAFNGAIARRRTSDREVNSLAAGKPTKGTPRNYWTLDTEEVVDIYPLVLRAIANTGPEPELSLDRVVTEVGRLVPDDGPARGQISATLARMTEIAAELARDPHGNPADPVMEYDSVTNPNDPTLHVVDPFFAFRLRWASPTGKAAPDATP